MKLRDQVYFIEDYKVKSGFITGITEQTIVQDVNGVQSEYSGKEYLVAQVPSFEALQKYTPVTLASVSVNKTEEALYTDKETAEKTCTTLIEKRDELNRKAKEEEQQRIENMAQVSLNELKERYPYTTLEELEQSLLKAFKEQELSIKLRKVKYVTQGMIKEN